jgi:hypothetical protein
VSNCFARFAPDDICTPTEAPSDFPSDEPSESPSNVPTPRPFPSVSGKPNDTPRPTPGKGKGKGSEAPSPSKGSKSTGKGEKGSKSTDKGEKGSKSTGKVEKGSKSIYKGENGTKSSKGTNSNDEGDDSEANGDDTDDEIKTGKSDKANGKNTKNTKGSKARVGLDIEDNESEETSTRAPVARKRALFNNDYYHDEMKIGEIEYRLLRQLFDQCVSDVIEVSLEICVLYVHSIIDYWLLLNGFTSIEASYNFLGKLTIDSIASLLFASITAPYIR